MKHSFRFKDGEVFTMHHFNITNGDKLTINEYAKELQRVKKENGKFDIANSDGSNRAVRDAKDLVAFEIILD